MIDRRELLMGLGGAALLGLAAKGEGEAVAAKPATPPALASLDVARMYAGEREYREPILAKSGIGGEWRYDWATRQDLAAIVHNQDVYDTLCQGGEASKHRRAFARKSYRMGAASRKMANHWTVLLQDGVYWSDGEGDTPDRFEQTGLSKRWPPTRCKVVWSMGTAEGEPGDAFAAIIGVEMQLELCHAIRKATEGRWLALLDGPSGKAGAMVSSLRDTLERRTGRRPDWIHTGHAVAEMLIGRRDSDRLIETTASEWEGMTLLHDHLTTDLLMGYRGKGPFSGDICLNTLVPFIPVQPLCLDPHDGSPRHAYQRIQEIVLRKDRELCLGRVCFTDAERLALMQ